MAEPILLIVRWSDNSDAAPTHHSSLTSSSRLSLPTNPSPHTYTLEVRPDTPIRVGSRVRLIALAKSAKLSPVRRPERYDFYDPHLLGNVVNVAAAAEEQGTYSTSFTVSNECARSTLCAATVRIPPSLRKNMEELVWANRDESLIPVADARMQVVWKLIREEDSCKGACCTIPVWLRGVDFASHAARPKALVTSGRRRNGRSKRSGRSRESGEEQSDVNLGMSAGAPAR